MWGKPPSLSISFDVEGYFTFTASQPTRNYSKNSVTLKIRQTLIICENNLFRAPNFGQQWKYFSLNFGHDDNFALECITVFL